MVKRRCSEDLVNDLQDSLLISKTLLLQPLGPRLSACRSSRATTVEMGRKLGVRRAIAKSAVLHTALSVPERDKPTA